VSELGLVLLVLGAALIVAETHVASHGALGSAAAAAIAVGIGLTVAGAGAGAAVGLAVGLAAGSIVAVYVAFVLSKTLTARRRPVRHLVGRMGEMRGERVFLDGALWRARTDDEELHAGDHVVVMGVNGLTLTVRKAEEWEL
jgi:membrane-bound ClpP family serine protease